MTDTHQAIYDAVRSRLSNGDIGNAVESAIRFANISHYADRAASTIESAAYEYMRPCVLFRPALSIDGNAWCALFGEKLQDGGAGVGETPAKAMGAFDLAWLNTKAPSAAGEKEKP